MSKIKSRDQKKTRNLKDSSRVKTKDTLSNKEGNPKNNRKERSKEEKYSNNTTKKGRNINKAQIEEENLGRKMRC